ncbi:MAG: hypothetical protein ABR863_01255 [Roseiarcus sp.]
MAADDEARSGLADGAEEDAGASWRSHAKTPHAPKTFRFLFLIRRRSPCGRIRIRRPAGEGSAGANAVGAATTKRCGRGEAAWERKNANDFKDRFGAATTPRPTEPAIPALSASAAAVAKPPSKGAIIGGDSRGLYKALGRGLVSLRAFQRSDPRDWALPWLRRPDSDRRRDGVRTYVRIETVILRQALRHIKAARPATGLGAVTEFRKMLNYEGDARMLPIRIHGRGG